MFIGPCDQPPHVGIHKIALVFRLGTRKENRFSGWLLTKSLFSGWLLFRLVTHKQNRFSGWLPTKRTGPPAACPKNNTPKAGLGRGAAGVSRRLKHYAIALAVIPMWTVPITTLKEESLGMTERRFLTSDRVDWPKQVSNSPFCYLTLQLAITWCFQEAACTLMACPPRPTILPPGAGRRAGAGARLPRWDKGSKYGASAICFSWLVLVLVMLLLCKCIYVYVNSHHHMKQRS